MMPSVNREISEILLYLQNPQADPTFMREFYPLLANSLRGDSWQAWEGVWLALARNPNCPADVLLELLWHDPEEVMVNPAVALLTLEDPQLFPRWLAEQIKNRGNRTEVQGLMGLYATPQNQARRDFLAGPVVATLSGFSKIKHPFWNNVPISISWTAYGFILVETQRGDHWWPDRAALLSHWKDWYWPGEGVLWNYEKFIKSATKKTGQWQAFEALLLAYSE